MTYKIPKWDRGYDHVSQVNRSGMVTSWHCIIVKIPKCTQILCVPSWYIIYNHYIYRNRNIYILPVLWLPVMLILYTCYIFGAIYTGADPRFQVRGGRGGPHLKKMRRTEGGANILGYFVWKKSRFYAKKSYFFQF